MSLKTAKLMLAYIYGTSDMQLSFPQAAALSEASDMYGVLSLHSQRLSVLMELMNPANIPKLQRLAVRHDSLQLEQVIPSSMSQLCHHA